MRVPSPADLAPGKDFSSSSHAGVWVLPKRRRKKKRRKRREEEEEDGEDELLALGIIYPWDDD